MYGNLVVERHQQPKRCVVDSLLQKRTQATGIVMGVNPLTVLHLNRNPPRAHGEHEIHFRFDASGWIVCHIEIRDAQEKVAQHTFYDPTRKVSQMRRSSEAFWSQRNNLLEPGGAQPMIAQHDFVRRPAFLESQFKRWDQPEEQ